MKIYTAPDEVKREDCSEDKIWIFLAGGITGCYNWQLKIINELESCPFSGEIVLFNPRRTDFDISNPNAAYEQIHWEFRYLNRMDAFTIYFAASETSDQPICMYELGRYLSEMQHRFPLDWKDRIVIGIEDGYSREKDVCIQTGLATDYMLTPLVNVTPELYAKQISDTARKMIFWRGNYGRAHV